jgi:hypothetical protein
MTDESVCRGLHFALKEFRDLPRRADENPGNISSGSTRNAGDPRDDRDAQIIDEDDNEVGGK